MIVIFGSQGQLGRTLCDRVGEAPEHVFLSRDSRDYCGDITNTAGITETLLELRPRIILNAAAYTAVDRAESEPDAAHAANARAPGVIAQVAARIDALLVHYSSDYVLDGSGSVPWRETDDCHPLSVYGASKRAGEKAVLASGARHFILRTSWVYSHHGNNFLKTMLRLAAEREEIRVVADQHGVPTHVDLIADTTMELIERSTPGLGSRGPAPASGIYHCAPAGETTWFEFARLVINTAKAQGQAQACTRITPIPTSAYPSAATRPLNSRLDTHLLQTVLGHDFPDWQDDVLATVHRVLHGPEAAPDEPADHASARGEGTKGN